MQHCMMFWSSGYCPSLSSPLYSFSSLLTPLLSSLLSPPPRHTLLPDSALSRPSEKTLLMMSTDCWIATSISGFSFLLKGCGAGREQECGAG